MSRLVIAGGGFAGFWAAAAAARVRRETPSLASLEILLISRDDRLVIRPRLYEPNPVRMAVPLIPRLEAIGVRFEQGEIASIDVVKGAIHAGDPISYDRLVLATGSQLARPAGLPGFDIDTLPGATALDRHLHTLREFPDSEGRWTVVIAGGGFTGIELATALPERLSALAGSPAKVRVIVVDPVGLIGASLGDGPSPAIQEALNAANIETRTGVTISSVDDTFVELSSGERISCH